MDGVWVKAIHDGQQLALRMAWNDPSRSPDPEWDEFFQGIRNTLAPVDGPLMETQGPDRFFVQWPVTPPEGTALPYFLGGDARRPVYVVAWSSDPDGVQEGTSTGLGTFAPLGSGEVGHGSSFGDGQWRLQLVRNLVPSDPSSAVTFVPGVPMPMAFRAADGTDAEDGIRGSVSAWYSIYLDVPTPTRVYIAPVITGLLTAVLGLAVVWQAQKRERGAG